MHDLTKMPQIEQFSGRNHSKHKFRQAMYFYKLERRRYIRTLIAENYDKINNELSALLPKLLNEQFEHFADVRTLALGDTNAYD